MLLSTYQEKIAKFAMYPKDQEFVYLSLGLCNELGEFYEKYEAQEDSALILVDELGDVLWYTTRLFSYFNVSMTFNENNANLIFAKDPVEKAIILAARIAGKAKKQVRGDAIVDISTMEYVLNKILFYIYKVARQLNLDLYQLAELNYNKLEDRYNRNVIKGSGDNR